jgi:hypothetical protein
MLPFYDPTCVISFLFRIFSSMPLPPVSLHANDIVEEAVEACGCNSPDSKLLHLLVPIRRAPDVISGACYAKNLLVHGSRIKVSLLHVTKPRREDPAFHSFTTGIDQVEEEHAEAMLKEAALHLHECQIPHRTYIISGDIVFSILDAAELLGCHEIVLPALQHRFWLRPFSGGLIGKIMQSAREVPVITVDSSGMLCNTRKLHRMRRKDRPHHHIEST